ncbi:EAL domain-containing protein [Azospirillum sp. B21]|uniref:EAL domain-containing protein n=1 Tax=Azospirillum sp. B21 TaxID=2607496 RepID=UPI0011EF62E6|nr:EAL domain-containing protein [Azospirillum sp. B21]KAA0581235.1 EAL domain-containing protein [Azospirillum sp. B21]
MSRFGGRPPVGRDRVRLSTTEKQAAVAAAKDQKPDFDNDKLLNLLRSAKNELQGMRLIHMHLSLLKDRDPTSQMMVRSIIQELATKASYLQSFNISNGDVIILYKGLKLTGVTDVCQTVEQVFLSKTTLTGPNPYKEYSLYSIMELALNFINVIRFIEELQANETGSHVTETKPPITLEELGKLERSMQMFDLSPFLFNQGIANIGGGEAEMEYYELYISIKLLQERLCPDYDITANKWLFNYFTANLDQSVLRALNHGLSFMRGRRIGININLSTVISTGFVKFDERLPIDFRGQVVLEVSKGDLIENLPLFNEVVEFAQDRRYQIAVDGLNPFWVTNFDLEYLNADYAKIFWSNDMLEMDPSFEKFFRERIAEQDRCKFILARCDSVSSLVYAHKMGINLVQGRAVDNIMRKGVSVREAIAHAKVD